LFVNAAYERERSQLGDRHFTAGKALTRVNDLSGAAVEFRKALLFAPDNTEYELSLATTLVDSRRFDEAESHLEQLSQQDPTNGRINLLLARVALMEHHTGQAVASFQRAVYEYWPPDEISERREARWELIDLLAADGHQRDQLVGELLQLYGNLPPHSDQRMRVGTFLLNAGADAEAGHVFRDVLKDGAGEPMAQLTADLVRAHSGLAQIAFRAGDFIEARHEYQRVLKQAPDDLATVAALELTNDIIDMAPQLPNISPGERLRRSENLLKRVEGDLRNCAGALDQQAVATGAPVSGTGTCPPDSGPASCALEQRLQEIMPANGRKLTDKDDDAARFQQAAEGLWKQRSTYCGQHHVTDPALEAVLPRVEHEQQ
jgi:tetratricopeptide (TPR) repeat protein